MKEDLKKLAYYYATAPYRAISSKLKKFKTWLRYTYQKQQTFTKLCLAITLISLGAKNTDAIIIFGILAIISNSIHIIKSGEHNRIWKARKL